MSKALEALRRIAIYNSWGAAQRGDSQVYISYRPADNGRSYQPAAWQVVDASGKKTDPGGYWRDYGHKTFRVTGRDNRGPQLEAAKQWVAEHYGIEEWARIPGLPGDHFPVQTVEAVKAALSE